MIKAEGTPFKGWVKLESPWEVYIEGIKRDTGYFSLVTKIGEIRNRRNKKGNTKC